MRLLWRGESDSTHREICVLHSRIACLHHKNPSTATRLTERPNGSAKLRRPMDAKYQYLTSVGRLRPQIVSEPWYRRRVLDLMHLGIQHIPEPALSLIGLALLIYLVYLVCSALLAVAHYMLS